MLLWNPTEHSLTVDNDGYSGCQGEYACPVIVGNAGTDAVGGEQG